MKRIIRYLRKRPRPTISTRDPWVLGLLESNGIPVTYGHRKLI